MLSKNYILFGEAVVVGAILTAFFWPRPIFEQITHHATGISFPNEGQTPSEPVPFGAKFDPITGKPIKPTPGERGCGTNCVCADVPGSSFNRTCVQMALPLANGTCSTHGQPCRLPQDPIKSSMDPKNMDVSPLAVGVNRLLHGQNVFTGDPILGGARPLEAVP